MKIVIDPGHGGSDRANRGPNGYIEADGVLYISLFLADALIKEAKAKGIELELVLTREEDKTVYKSTRGKMAKDADLFISQHTNAYNGKARGTEVFYSIERPEDRELASEISEKIAYAFNIPNRGAKTKESITYPGRDYFTVFKNAVNVGAKKILLVESMFHDNIHDEKILLDNANLKVIAEIQSTIILNHLAGKEEKPYPGVPDWALEAWEWSIEAGINDGIVQNETEIQTVKMLHEYHKKYHT
jgi:N-acetylmuramoyl-L-alanine amidase